MKFVAVAKVIAIITMADIPAVGSEDERRVRADDMSERQGGLRIRRNSGELIEQEKRSIPGLCEQIATISFWQQSLKYCLIDQEALKSGELFVRRQITIRVGQVGRV